jgi:hypothetical protein
LAAGFDKDAKLYKELSNFWFWFYRNRNFDRGTKKETLKNVCFVRKIRQLLTEWVLIMVECSAVERLKANTGVLVVETLVKQS